ncbi:MAG: hypothetical protein Q8S84_04210 [bacterium]|nr:hypothetical protein [bacterium]MDP3380708.1 hypothetical protein [bacterium]
MITFAQSLISLLIIEITDFSLPGTIDDENITVSHLIISTDVCFHSAILDRAENSSHWLHVVIIICLCGAIHSVFLGVIFLTIPCLIFRYHNSLAIATFSTILLPLKKIVLSCFSHISINC